MCVGIRNRFIEVISIESHMQFPLFWHYEHDTSKYVHQAIFDGTIISIRGYGIAEENRPRMPGGIVKSRLIYKSSLH